MSAPADARGRAGLRDGEQARDPRALEAVMRLHNRRLYRIARAMLRDAAEAEDALQDSYCNAFRSIRLFRGEAALATWLTRIVVNECNARLRKQARRDNIVPIVPAVQSEVAGSSDEDGLEAPSAVDEHTPEKELAGAEMRRILERQIDRLPGDFRVVFVMRAVEELSVEETAAGLGIAEATVRTRHFRARSLLREALAREVDLAERGLFGFDGARCDRIVAAVLARVVDDDREWLSCPASR